MGLGAITVERGGVGGLDSYSFFLYALLVRLIVDLLLTKTLSDSRFYVSSYYLGLFIHVGMGRLGSR